MSFNPDLIFNTEETLEQYKEGGKIVCKAVKPIVKPINKSLNLLTKYGPDLPFLRSLKANPIVKIIQHPIVQNAERVQHFTEKYDECVQKGKSKLACQAGSVAGFATDAVVDLTSKAMIGSGIALVGAGTGMTSTVVGAPPGAATVGAGLGTIAAGTYVGEQSRDFADDVGTLLTDLVDSQGYYTVDVPEKVDKESLPKVINKKFPKIGSLDLTKDIVIYNTRTGVQTRVNPMDILDQLTISTYAGMTNYFVQENCNEVDESLAVVDHRLKLIDETAPTVDNLMVQSRNQYDNVPELTAPSKIDAHFRKYHKDFFDSEKAIESGTTDTSYIKGIEFHGADYYMVSMGFSLGGGGGGGGFCCLL